MILYKTTQGPVVEQDGNFYPVPEQDWDRLFNHDDLAGYLADQILVDGALPRSDLDGDILPPIGSQEVWAAGVTFFRSRTARMEEAKEAGGSDFYDRVYHADRPELFFKATPHRVVGTGQAVHLRSDSKWIVPEPELTVAIAWNGQIVGYTIGNDLSCRDIEGENPLYLPQAKVFDSCAAIGPGIWITDAPPSDETVISLEISRGGRQVFQGATNVGQMKRKPPELVAYLFQDNSFPQGCLLMTGTGVVPPDDFSLQREDEIRITIAPIGTLTNVAMRARPVTLRRR